MPLYHHKITENQNVFSTSGFDEFGHPSWYDSAEDAGCSAYDKSLIFSLDAAKGFVDLSKNPCTLTNQGVTISDGCFVFDGASYINTNRVDKLNLGSGDFTIEIVMNLSTGNSDRAYPTLIGGIDGWNTGANGLRWNGTHKRKAFCVFLNPGDPLLYGNYTFPPSNAAFITYAVQRRSGVWMQFYEGIKDSNTVTSSASYDLCHTTGMSIGRSSWDGYDGYHIGKIRSINIYNEAKYEG